ncbi:MAG TPA: HPr family phosphocarrier protein [Anaerolineae bacterium]
MARVRLTVNHKAGLHARPAAVFVLETNKYQADVCIRNVTKQSGWVNAKSILSVLTLGVEKGHEIELEAEGKDEAEAIQALALLIGGDFV